ncbi:MAG: hypothetical protein COA75_02210 [Cellvibrionales bacterium]|nr:MAG: hypothetical protein COA75_02210 [Cellvibrionales bacterium]
MLLSKIWKRIKKPIFVGLSILASIFACFLILHITYGSAEIIFSEILSSFSAVVIFCTTLSVVIFNYIDNISKDIFALGPKNHKIGKALESLSSLKKEVVVNACFILALLIIELAARGLTKSISPENIPFESFNWVVMSVRFGIFVLAIMAVSEQIRGLLVAIEYRNVIHAGKSSKK